MTTKLDGYTLPERVKTKMVLTLFKTHQDKKELGFTLCSKSENIIRVGGDFTGSPDKIIIDSRMCKEDEKFLGGYHTHYERDSYPSAEDLRYCGVLKTMCTGGSVDNKIRCNTWKHGSLSQEEYNKMISISSRGTTKSEDPKYQPNFDCIRDIVPLFLEEKYIKEEVDKDLDEKKLHLSILRRSALPEHVIIESENEIINNTEKRNRSAHELTKKIKEE